ncbi:MAG: sulfurtransferase TusA family protein [Candidatus Rokubacteria bacterium]|nr:sulfurtransferase TusA family protein [Candidatus Rokubacteria bacterium]MBI4628794.1 sulfurtransferase TusA family protein [Candidatus Rokubacteria bacterium]
MLLKKFFNVGFEAIEAHDRRPFGLDDLRRYPLFTREFLDFLGQALPPERHGEVVWSVVVTAGKPRVRTEPRHCAACRHDNASEARFCSRCGARLTADTATEAARSRPDALCDLGDSGCEAGSLLKVRNLVASLASGQTLEIRSTNPAARDEVPAWCRMTGHEYLGSSESRYFVRKR